MIIFLEFNKMVHSINGKIKNGIAAAMKNRATPIIV